MIHKFKFTDSDKHYWLNTDHIVHIRPVDKSKEWATKSPGEPKKPWSKERIENTIHITLTSQDKDGNHEGVTARITSRNMWKLRIWMFL